MMKVELTTKEYSLVRSALEALYYIEKDEGNKRKLNEITKFEEKLIKALKDFE